MKQPMIETYVFGTDFVAMKHVMEALCSICYKILMVGVHLSEWSYAYGDNISIINNIQRPELNLRKKSNSIC